MKFICGILVFSFREKTFHEQFIMVLLVVLGNLLDIIKIQVYLVSFVEVREVTTAELVTVWMTVKACFSERKEKGSKNINSTTKGKTKLP